MEDNFNNLKKKRNPIKQLFEMYPVLYYMIGIIITYLVEYLFDFWLWKDFTKYRILDVMLLFAIIVLLFSILYPLIKFILSMLAKVHLILFVQEYFKAFNALLYIPLTKEELINNDLYSVKKYLSFLKNNLMYHNIFGKEMYLLPKKYDLEIRHFINEDLTMNKEFFNLYIVLYTGRDLGDYKYFIVNKEESLILILKDLKKEKEEE